MTGTFDEIARAALLLPESEKAGLARTLLRSLEPKEESGVEAAWEIEIARRLEEIREGRAIGRPAEEVFRDIRARYQ